MTQPAYDLDALRQQFIPAQHDIAYVNHAGMSPLPYSSQNAMKAIIDKMGALGSQAYAENVYDALRQRVATLVGAQADDVAFVQNTSLGINLIAQSLRFERGDEVILCDVEFPSNVYPWLNLRHKGVKVRLLPAEHGGLNVERLGEALSDRTRVVACSAVQYFTGRHEDLAAIGALCAAHDITFVVDAIQGAGIVPIDMEAMQIDAVVAGGQKALLGPPGQGFMVMRQNLIAEMQPPVLGATSVTNYTDWLTYDVTPRAGAPRFELGTINIAGLHGLHASIGLLLDLEVKNIYDWVRHLSEVACDDLEKRGLAVITPQDRLAHIVTFEYPEDPFKAVATLQQHGVILREHMDADGKPHLRISTHAYNTEQEVLRVGYVLEEIL